MKRVLTFYLLATAILSACSSPQFDQSIDQLIALKQESNKRILHDIDSVLRLDEVEDYVQLRDKLKKMDREVNTFIGDLDMIADSEQAASVLDFAEKTFAYRLQYPMEIKVTADTPPSLMKLALVDNANLVMREWKDIVTYKFNTMAPAIVFDKINFGPKEPVTGRIFIVAYNTDMKPDIKIDGKSILVKEGVGHFSFLPGAAQELPVAITIGETVFESMMKLK
ncbi:MAG TPA: hypothetical protein VK508_18590 [Cyclobacteriaceae bacterium]|nr:hypothetical protein [Cyclobacteriaceae bacterium]